MNAYELADALQGSAPYGLDDAARVLRQQADCIALLEEQIKDAVEIGIAEGFAKALTQYPPATTPQTIPKNIKPVWIGKAEQSQIKKLAQDIKYNVTIKWDDKTTHHTNVSEDTLLPYTTPQIKELSDEEILELWDWNSGEILATDLLDFADAILRKAQEK